MTILRLFQLVGRLPFAHVCFAGGKTKRRLILG